MSYLIDYLGTAFPIITCVYCFYDARNRAAELEESVLEHDKSWMWGLQTLFVFVIFGVVGWTIYAVFDRPWFGGSVALGFPILAIIIGFLFGFPQTRAIRENTIASFLLLGLTTTIAVIETGKVVSEAVQHLLDHVK
jgi:uncharacterized ion transporter superfamily protein YfcC